MRPNWHLDNVRFLAVVRRARRRQHHRFMRKAEIALTNIIGVTVGIPVVIFFGLASLLGKAVYYLRIPFMICIAALVGDATTHWDTWFNTLETHTSGITLFFIRDGMPAILAGYAAYAAYEFSQKMPKPIFRTRRSSPEHN